MEMTAPNRAWGDKSKSTGVTSATPPTADRIRLSCYDPVWPLFYSKEQQRLEKVLSSCSPIIDHIGSTAVRGLRAKPVIDVVVGLHNHRQLRDCINLLTEAGYSYLPQFESVVPERRFFEVTRRCSSGNTIKVHVHAALKTSVFCAQRIQFRDSLRRSRAISAAYARLKTRLAKQYPDNRRAYSAAKGDFITGVLQLDRSNTRQICPRVDRNVRRSGSSSTHSQFSTC